MRNKKVVNYASIWIEAILPNRMPNCFRFSPDRPEFCFNFANQLKGP